MTFENIELPAEALLGSSMGPEFLVDVIEYGIGGRQANVHSTQPRWRFQLHHKILPEDIYSQVIGFFTALKGPAVGFLLTNPLDNSTANGTAVTANMNTGEGDGTKTEFPLYRNYTAGAQGVRRRIWKPKENTVVVAVNGVATTAIYNAAPVSGEVSVNTNTGMLTFFDPPALGEVISWGGEYFTPVALGSPESLSSIMTPDAYHDVQLTLVELLKP